MRSSSIPCASDVYQRTWEKLAEDRIKPYSYKMWIDDAPFIPRPLSEKSEHEDFKRFIKGAFDGNGHFKPSHFRPTKPTKPTKPKEPAMNEKLADYSDPKLSDPLRRTIIDNVVKAFDNGLMASLSKKAEELKKVAGKELYETVFKPVHDEAMALPLAFRENLFDDYKSSTFRVFDCKGLTITLPSPEDFNEFSLCSPALEKRLTVNNVPVSYTAYLKAEQDLNDHHDDRNKLRDKMLKLMDGCERLSDLRARWPLVDEYYSLPHEEVNEFLTEYDFDIAVSTDHEPSK